MLSIVGCGGGVAEQHDALGVRERIAAFESQPHGLDVRTTAGRTYHLRLATVGADTLAVDVAALAASIREAAAADMMLDAQDILRISRAAGHQPRSGTPACAIAAGDATRRDRVMSFGASAQGGHVLFFQSQRSDWAVSIDRSDFATTMGALASAWAHQEPIEVADLPADLCVVDLATP